MKYDFLSKYYYKGQDVYFEEYNRRTQGPGCTFYNFEVNSNQIFVLTTMEMLELTTSIHINNSQLKSTIKQLPNVALESYQYSCLIDEILMTNDMEGIHSTRREIKDVLSAKPEDRTKRFAGLVKKYLLLMQNSSEIPLKNCEDIRSLYDEIVLDEVRSARGENVPDGELFRKSIAEVISGTQKVKHVGLHPEERIIDAMNQALSILNSNQGPLLVRTAIFHYLFGYIHPFYDGNGRTSRFISSYLLSQELDPLVAYRLSFAIKEKKESYYKAFDHCNDTKNKGDLTPFVIMFLKMVSRAIDNLSIKVNEGCEKLDFYHSLLDKAYQPKDKMMSSVLFYLIQCTLFSVDLPGRTELIKHLDSSYPTVSAIINKLIKDGAPITEKKEGRRKIVYALDLDKTGDYLKNKIHSTDGLC